jgi:uncharacterized protein (DUF2267 family)
MVEDEFFELVRERGHMQTREEAKRATRATLQTLGERLSAEEPRRLAERLPPGIGDYLREERAGAGEELSMEEFFERVAKKEGVSIDVPRATYHARVVMEAVGATTYGEIENVREQLPAEYDPLFEAGSQGEMSTR